MVEKVFIREGKTYHAINIKDILFVSAEGDYVNIFLDRRKFRIHLTLGAIAELLPKTSFLRVNRSYVINYLRINKIEDKMAHIDNNIQGGTYQIPIGEHFWPLLKEQVPFLGMNPKMKNEY